jgi:hypothetical protein
MINAVSAIEPQTSVFSLTIAPHEGRLEQPVVGILFDGVDFLASLNRVGFDPDVILGPDSPLLPALWPGRVAVYQCTCTVPGCGVAAPIIEQVGALVRWSDFRTYTGVFEGPVEVLGRTGRGQLLSDREFYFDAEQYAAAIASVRRYQWETPARVTARLVREALEVDPRVAEAGLEVGWVWAITWRVRRPITWQIGFRHHKRREFVIELGVGPGSPEERAAIILDILDRKPVETWARRFPVKS